MPKISPWSEVSPKAVLADDVEIGPFCIVGPDVKLGAGCRISSHVVMTGHTTAGVNNVFYPHCVVGADPQDKKFQGETSYLEIGDNNQIRESVTIHTGTSMGGGYTRIGHRNLIMGTCHIAHDVQIANDCILANCVQLAGHIAIGNRANLAGLVGVHHFVSIGEYSYVAGVGRIRHDVPPYVRVDDDGRERALNLEGLRRAKFDPADIEALSVACRKLFLRKRPQAVAMREFEGMDHLNPHVKILLDFLRRRSASKNGRYLESLRSAQSQTAARK
jgi:UDP-N-acetylglucosamine acyltransferase